MSMSAQYHAREWAKGKSVAEIRARIAELEAAPRWQGIEFDDARVNHMRQTEIDTLRKIWAEAEPLFYVWSVKHGQWWGPNKIGYTDSITNAGRYTAQEADEIEYRSQRAGAFDQVSVRIPVSNLP